MRHLKFFLFGEIVVTNKVRTCGTTIMQFFEKENNDATLKRGVMELLIEVKDIVSTIV